MKVWRTFGHPLEELCKTWVGAKRLWRGVVAGEVGLGQCRVDFVVTDLMQQHRWSALAPAELRNEVVEALLGVRRNGPVAKGADRIAHGLRFWRSVHG